MKKRIEKIEWNQVAERLPDWNTNQSFDVLAKIIEFHPESGQYKFFQVVKWSNKFGFVVWRYNERGEFKMLNLSNPDNEFMPKVIEWAIIKGI